MKTVYHGCFFLIVMTVLSATPYHVADAASLLLYDNFNSQYIDPARWLGQESESKSSYPILRENIRQIQGKRLRLLARAWACTECGDDGHLYGENRLKPLKLENATILKATVQVKAFSLAGSDTNTDTAMARARILGFFFNDGSSLGADDATGDVYAWIGIYRKSDSTAPENLLSVDAYVKRCNDSSCKFGQTVLGKITQLGTLTVGDSATLKMQWDKAKHRFLFTLNAETPQIIDYGVTPIVNPPITENNRRLEVHLEVPNRTISPRPMAFMDAYFDSVYYK